MLTAWSVRMAEGMLIRHPVAGMRWRYEDGFLMKAMEQLGPEWGFAGEVGRYVGRLVDGEGKIAGYRLEEYNLDQILPGRLLFGAWEACGEARYRRAVELLREQLRLQPRTRAGGFWHKRIYPHQMWLDGIYMASPFYAQYAATFAEPAGFDDLARQILTIEQRTRDPESGLLYHAWDEGRLQAWCDPVSGRSRHFWSRGMGWYVMGLVDVLDYLPAAHGQAEALVAVLRRALDALLSVRDPASGLWYQVLDLGDRPGNYLEASGACMFVYALAKGVRKGYLPRGWLDVAGQSYAAILERFVTVGAGGQISLGGICGVAGLGGEARRDGSFEDYVSEKVVSDEPKGVVAFILASREMEEASAGAGGEGQGC